MNNGRLRLHIKPMEIWGEREFLEQELNGFVLFISHSSDETSEKDITISVKAFYECVDIYMKEVYEPSYKKCYVSTIIDLLRNAKTTTTSRYTFKENISKIICENGTTLSVQASSGHYCSPRKDRPEEDWTKVEVGYPSVSPEGVVDWARYFDGDYYKDNHCESVYGYVPIESVVKYINHHGGIKAND